MMLLSERPQTDAAASAAVSAPDRGVRRLCTPARNRLLAHAADSGYGTASAGRAADPGDRAAMRVGGPVDRGGDRPPVAERGVPVEDDAAARVRLARIAD